MGSLSRKGIWSTDEHDRFLDAISHFPHGPWSELAKFVGTRSARQVQTHAQKYYEKIARHLRGLQRDRKPVGGNEHRIEERLLSLVLAADKPPMVEKLCKTPPGSKRDGHYETTPPCLQRLQELPSSPVSVDNVVPMRVLHAEATWGCHERSQLPWVDGTLPSLEQSLDFLIELFSSPDDVQDAVAQYTPLAA